MRFEAFALAMLAADLVGVMDSAVAAAADYVKSRAQFGVAVGTFQAVQHLAAEAKVLLEGVVVDAVRRVGRPTSSTPPTRCRRRDRPRRIALAGRT